MYKYHCLIHRISSHSKMTQSYSSIVLLTTGLVLLCLAISSVQAYARWNEVCVEQNNQPNSCERNKAFTCDRSTRRCTCFAGQYNKEQDRCTVRLGEVCALQNHQESNVACNSP